MKLDRRRFLTLAGAGLAAAGGWIGLPRLVRTFSGTRQGIPGEIVGASHALGHRLREGGFPAPMTRHKTTVVIAGAGIAGLSAAWKLRRSGMEDFILLDLEPEIGGTARSGTNSISRYPWGAHYLPIPGPHAAAVRELLEEMGVITGWTADGQPRYDEHALCFAPQERLFIHGRWQEGLFPTLAASARDLTERDRFLDQMRSFRDRTGSDGRPAFMIPMEASSREADLLALDGFSMADWMSAQGYRSRRLRWYADYCCRDDFGCSLQETSAWAGIHYFASREDADLLTWPEGNGRLVDALSEGLGDRAVRNALVIRIDENAHGVSVDYLDARTGEVSRIESPYVICALPHFIARRLVSGLHGGSHAFEYAPWMVANLTLSRPPPVAPRDAPLSWDNVLYESSSLGYVCSTHQGLQTAQGPTVLTYYRPFSGDAPAAVRARMLETPIDVWQTEILKDLSRAHPGLRETVTNIDVMLWGHAMVRPRPGFIWGPGRMSAPSGTDRVKSAHSDMSGMALFEEAQFRGILASETVMRKMGVSYASSLGPLERSGE